MSRLITVHNTADEPIYDIVIEKDFQGWLKLLKSLELRTGAYV